MSQEQNYSNHILGIAWLILLLFPVGNTFYALVPLVFVCLYEYRKARFSIANKWALGLIVAIFLSLLFNVLEIYIFSNKLIQRDITNAIILFTFANLRGNTILKSYIWFGLIYIFLSQISFVYNIPILTNFYDNVYHITSFYYEQLSIDNSNYDVGDAGVSLRLGGIYYNPNNCASFITLIFALGLCEQKQFKRYELIAFCALALIAIMFTGSRTSILVFLAMLCVYAYVNNKGSKLVVPILLIVGILILATLNLDFLKDFRMFKIEEGMNDSFGMKMSIISRYINYHADIFDLIFGAGGAEALVYKYNQHFAGTDCDLGDILVSYGLLFYFLYISFYIAIYRKLKREYVVILLVLMWMFSNTILFSYRMSSVWFLTLGVLYKKSITNSSNEVSI